MKKYFTEKHQKILPDKQMKIVSLRWRLEQRMVIPLILTPNASPFRKMLAGFSSFEQTESSSPFTATPTLPENMK